ncbi:PGF-pre-PGF domain-containing protein [Candidatus Woesearchaeota archaeon]|jgi:PGF-pre-PGF domain-containing protein|nr:PGF-pre-PGF domain-containing protein [Candidatus Woesearchaeota archaeon]MBT3537325.1 PGF-pre-PGF domain-containing protein [Candidatus Woesearchaeota archaeon]MBT4697405.1 PGF-pre-PGF domain-containing protein [Candidatus Woesearchaeota archaeon]MBT4716709.1 PGF-pre-PGF domain-containing protein [Candidatus Woesearchaeota archaeon]MBT7106365.1 PGF-pre-PGF domain-containing protein [Candidatus Woesearchaeota archaeon]
MRARNKLSIVMVLLVLTLFALSVNADPVYLSYLNTSSNSTLFGPYLTSSSYSASLQDTNYTIKIASEAQDFAVYIPNIEVSSTPTINLSTKNLSASDFTNASLDLGPTTSYDYYVREAYAFEIGNEDEINKTYTIEFNDTYSIEDPIIMKLDYDFTSNTTSYSNASYLTATDLGTTITTTTDSVSLFLLVDNRTDDNAPSPATPTSPGGSGGGSGSSNRGRLYMPQDEYESLILDKVSRLYEILGPSRPLKFPVNEENFAILNVLCELNSNARMVSMRIEKMSGRPEKVEAPNNAKELDYYNIIYDNLDYEDIKHTKMTFYVLKDTLQREGIEPDKVRLYRYHQGITQSTEELDTRIIEEQNDRYIYQSEMEGLSFFIIGATGYKPAPETETNSPKVETPKEITQKVSTLEQPKGKVEAAVKDALAKPFSEPAEQTELNLLAYLQAFVLFMILVVLVIGGFVVYKHKHVVVKPQKVPATQPTALPEQPKIEPKPSIEPQQLIQPDTHIAKSVQPARKVKMLEAYIYRQLAKGTDKQQLKQTLMEKGWPESLLNSKLNVVPKQPSRKIKELEAYIYHELAKGFKKDEIRNALNGAGWPTEVLTKEFKKLDKLEGEFKKQSLHEVHTDLDAATESVRKLLNKGHSEEKIRKIMINKGWHRAAVEILFNDLKR